MTTVKSRWSALDFSCPCWFTSDSPSKNNTGWRSCCRGRSGSSFSVEKNSKRNRTGAAFDAAARADRARRTAALALIARPPWAFFPPAHFRRRRRPKVGSTSALGTEVHTDQSVRPPLAPPDTSCDWPFFAGLHYAALNRSRTHWHPREAHHWSAHCVAESSR